jgi:rhodanese-related sulfurtransferase
MFNEYVVDVDGSTVVAFDTEVGTTVVLFDAGGRVNVVVGAIVSLDGTVDSGTVVVVIAGGIGGYVGAGDVG